MTRPGPKPRSYLAVVREGNPGHRPVQAGMMLSGELTEPDWSQLLPGPREMARARRVAAELWRRLAPALQRSAGLTGEMSTVLQDYCITVARIDQGERALSRQGVMVGGYRGSQVKNPWTTILSQYRSHLRSLTGELGLSPSAAGRITGPPPDDGEDPFA